MPRVRPRVCGGAGHGGCHPLQPGTLRKRTVTAPSVRQPLSWAGHSLSHRPLSSQKCSMFNSYALTFHFQVFLLRSLWFLFYRSQAPDGQGHGLRAWSVCGRRGSNPPKVTAPCLPAAAHLKRGCHVITGTSRQGARTRHRWAFSEDVTAGPVTVLPSGVCPWPTGWIVAFLLQALLRSSGFQRGPSGPAGPVPMAETSGFHLPAFPYKAPGVRCSHLPGGVSWAGGLS